MDEEWYFGADGRTVGPVTLDDLRWLWETGELRPDDPVWTKGMEDWQPAKSLPEIVSPPSPLDRPRILAVGGIVFSALGPLLCTLLGFVGLVFSIAGLREALRSEDSGRVLPIAGIVLGVVNVILVFAEFPGVLLLPSP